MDIRSLQQKLQASIFNDSETPSLDAQVLLAHITGNSRARLLAHQEEKLTPEQQKTLEAAISSLQAGVPLPYIIGYWEFYGLNFTINAHTLIPRPETELLIEEALKWLQAHPEQRQAVDVGTGSGCIAIALAKTIPNLQVIATDISSEALEVAHTNAQKHAVSDRITFIQTDLLSLPTFHYQYPMICANLPYIPTRTLESLDVFGREPTLALDGGPDGLSLIRRLLPQAVQHLASGGLLLIEIENTQGKAVLNLAEEFFPETRIDLLPDLAGQDRLIRIETFIK